MEAAFEHAAVVFTETSWSKADNAATYCLERIQDGKPGITDLEQAIPGLKLALELVKQIE